VAQPNYRHARKQKELNRKLKQAEKQQRRAANKAAAAPTVEAGTGSAAGAEPQKVNPGSPAHQIPALEDRKS
jgi:hypothetical protein